MGNAFVGRPRVRAYLDEVPGLNLRQWQHLKLMQAGSVFSCSWPGGQATVLVERGHVVLLWGERTERIMLVRTTGGVAPCTWFLCPSCGRRCTVIHIRRELSCRGCARLTYRSQSEAPPDRALRRAQRIRQNLGAGRSLFEPLPPRPKGTRRATYTRLLGRLVASEARVWPRFIRRLNALATSGVIGKELQN